MANYRQPTSALVPEIARMQLPDMTQEIPKRTLLARPVARTRKGAVRRKIKRSSLY